MSTLVLTTVGTSALTNKYVDSIDDPKLAKLKTWAKKSEDVFSGDPQYERELAEQIKNNWRILGGRGQKSVSAEIASLGRILEYYKILKDEGSRFVFLASDTKQGQSCARVNLLAFRSIFGTCSCEADADGRCSHIYCRCLDDIQHKDHERFAHGVNGFRARIETEKMNFLDGRSERDLGLIFNMTGAYKGLAPWASDECKTQRFTMAYLYEDSERLIFKPPRERADPVPEE